MTRRVMFPILIGLLVPGPAAPAAGAGDEQEENVALDQVPEAVRVTILNESAGAAITEIERETTKAGVVYEAEFVLDGREIEIRIAEDGALLGRQVEGRGDAEGEGDLTIDQISEPARSALIRLAGGAQIVSAEREREHGVLIYEAEWEAGGTRHEAAVTADGTLVEIEELVPLDMLPEAVRGAVSRLFGIDARVVVAKKMIVIYEVEAKIDGREKEVYVFPTGRVHEEHGDDHDDGDDDNGDDDEDDVEGDD